MSYPGTDGLLREWNDYVRLIEESGPVQEVQQQTAALERQRESLHEEARQLLERAGGGPTDPGHLDLTAGGIRQLHAALERLAEFDKSWGWLDDEQRATEEALEEIRVRAAKLLETAGLRYDRERPWAGHLDALAGRVRAAVRFRLLKSELVPQTERLLLDVRTVEDLRSQLERMTAETTPAGPPGAESAPRPQAEIEAETERLRAALEDMSGRREKLRRDVEKADPLQAQLAEKQTEFERIERALRRARRFKRAVELARETIQAAAFDTHRRWAEFLNVRVGDLLAAVGTQAGQVRFGEDLDFSLRLANGQQVSRGKAVLQLSSGARDQLHLAVRLAISEYLSRGRDALPLLLDDGFASSDDERARAGMKLLIEHFTALHQIIVVTCHRKRHEALAAMDPELYAQRVYWPDPRAARLAG
jgi:DNA repair exonuclease SbcCD ATPase subunit